MLAWLNPNWIYTIRYAILGITGTSIVYLVIARTSRLFVSISTSAESRVPTELEVILIRWIRYIQTSSGQISGISYAIGGLSNEMVLTAFVEQIQYKVFFL